MSFVCLLAEIVLVQFLLNTRLDVFKMIKRFPQVRFESIQVPILPGLSGLVKRTEESSGNVF